MLAFAISRPDESQGYGSNLTAGQWLYPGGQQLFSPDGAYKFVMQTDSNLVLYHTGTPTVAHWSSGTYLQSVIGAVMQDDGNFVIYGPPWTALWASNTSGNPGAYLVLQDDGNAVIYRASGAAIWATNTYDGDHSPEKSLYPDRWYQRLSDSGSYSTWMTLSGHRHYEANMQSLWSGPITGALNGYNSPSQPGGTHTVSVGDYAPASWHDVHTWASSDGCVIDTLSVPSAGTTYTPPVPGWCTFELGQIFLLDEQYHACPNGNCDASHSRPNTWWFAVALLNDAQHTGAYTFRQSTAAHELGHAIGLAHDGFGDNNSCGTGVVPQTIMDYDCADDFNTARRWDSCGINHAYYDPNWRWSGC